MVKNGKGLVVVPKIHNFGALYNIGINCSSKLVIFLAPDILKYESKNAKISVNMVCYMPLSYVFTTLCR